MNKERDILGKIRESGSPFSVPDGYFNGIEDRVREKISATESKSPVWSVAKPALILTCMFAVILGIGYGTMTLTGTRASVHPTEPEEAELLADRAFSLMEDDELIDYLAENLSSSDIEMLITDLQTN